MDVNNFAIGKVLMLDGWPIAYESKKHNNGKKKWSIHEENFRHSVLLEDVASLFRAAQQPNVHKQYVLELF